MTEINPGDTVDVVIRGVQFAYERTIDHRAGLTSIRADDGRRYTMPAQAAITPHKQPEPDATAPALDSTEPIAKALALLDAWELEGYIEPYVAAGVRKALGLPPRHWPPQPGDVWDDGMPWDSLWFARAYPEEGENDAWPTRTYVVMTNVRGGGNTKSPQELLESVRSSRDDLTLLYRRKDGAQ
ncbi:hypothetical protein [Nonomuraea sp. SYSU D8015]|uniref:hypothetical protein n=1 Tax=Nonomuraea sp. SYSU D8015 TaxID=2593644 RepID=UPI0016607B86|nr:hypothetical protein [Nonomuraea sp. SYSU D8015]